MHSDTNDTTDLNNTPPAAFPVSPAVRDAEYGSSSTGMTRIRAARPKDVHGLAADYANDVAAYRTYTVYCASALGQLTRSYQSAIECRERTGRTWGAALPHILALADREYVRSRAATDACYAARYVARSAAEAARAKLLAHPKTGRRLAGRIADAESAADVAVANVVAGVSEYARAWFDALEEDVYRSAVAPR